MKAITGLYLYHKRLMSPGSMIIESDDSYKSCQLFPA